MKEQFEKAPQVLVTMPSRYRAMDSFVPVRAYAGFKPEHGEIGFLLVNGKIFQRVFAA